MPQRRLLVDRVLGDSLEIPPGVDRWLRAIEQRALELHDALHRELQAPVVITRLHTVHGRVEEFLKDEHSSLLHRLLRRPLSQLAPGSPAYHGFSVYTDHLFREAEVVLYAQRGAVDLQADRIRLHQAWEARMPYFVRESLGRARVDASELLEVRRPSDVRMLQRRLERAKAEVERLARYLPEATGYESHLALADLGSVSPAELWAALQLRLRERAHAGRAHSRTERLRILQARQVSALGRASQWSRTAETPVHAAAEHLAHTSLLGDARAVAPWEDGGLWTALLNAAERSRFEGATQADAWQPRIAIPPRGSAPRTEDHTVVYALPFATEFVYLSTAIPGPVRVWSRAIAEGEPVECRVFGEPGSAVPVASVHGDIAPLFDGTSRDPAWYATQRHALVEIICSYGSGWFARVRSRGAVRRLHTPAWREGDGTATAVRAFISGQDRETSGDVIPVGMTDAVPQSFLGLETREVFVPHLDSRVAWLRVPDGSAASEAALQREHETFRALRRLRPHLALATLGRGLCTGDQKAGFLYVPPLAFHADGSPLLQQWVQEHPASFLQAAARVLQYAHQAGYALGIYHPDMFAFGLEPLDTGTFRPRATLVAAPGAARLGHAFPLAGRGLRAAARYPNLGFSGLPPAVMEGEVALPETDVAGFALLLLDVMAARSALPSKPTTRWQDLSSFVERHAGAFADAELALRIAHALSSKGGAPLLEIVEDLARARPEQ